MMGLPLGIGGLMSPVVGWFADLYSLQTVLVFLAGSPPAGSRAVAAPSGTEA